MADQVDILDFNKTHRNSNKLNQEPDILSSQNKKQLITLDDVDSLIQQIKMPQSRNFEFPSSLEKSIIHSQSFYIQPNKKFLNKNPKLISCDCCGQMIRRNRYNIFTCDMYSIFAGDYGISIPLYFSIIKLHFFILLIIGCIFGIYYCYLSELYCGMLNRQNYTENALYEQCCSSYLAAQHFLLYSFNQEEIINKNYDDQETFYILGYIAYLIMMLTPFMHEILLRLQQIKYWNYDSFNHLRIPKLTLYIKHIPKKFNELELQQQMQNAISSYYKEKIGEKIIDEIVYIYDIHPIKVLNEKRKDTYLQILQIVNQLQIETKLELKGQLIDLVFQLRKQTRDIFKILQYGLPFTSKVILKFNSEQVTNLIYEHFNKLLLNKLLIRIDTIKESAQNYKEFKKDQIELQAQLLEKSEAKSLDIPKILNQSDLSEEVAVNQSEMFKYQLQDDLKLVEEQQEQNLQNSIINEKKGLHLKKGFRQEEILWENIGMHTLKRFYLRLLTTMVTLILGIIIMAIYEGLYVWQKNLEDKTDWVSKLIIYLIIIFTVILQILSTILVIIMTKRAQRFTYSQQEKNIITFMSPIQQVCIFAFPFIFVLSSMKEHAALNHIYVLMELTKLVRFRIIAKGIFHILHQKLLRFKISKKKIIKKFQPTSQFQKKLNELLTPPLFPIRSRLFFILYLYSTGMVMLFFNPTMILWCLVIQIIIYYYDKFSVLSEYRCDKLFTFQLFRYLILVYQTIMIPIYCYIYIVTFTNINQDINSDGILNNQYSKVSLLWTYLGYGTFILSFISFIFFRKKIANFFVFVVFRVKRPLRDATIFKEKSFLQSYKEYFNDLGVMELNQIFDDITQNMASKSK
ncbi:unnamed protein product [Paramecium sonneborni]|uniref:Transmembrane protein n=1 Tax=Paramecium sonneborni TaxID=65129 RepID=A0A8S1M772_9CILI|nr:unnamed protein product [Paramecium sonneborni]